MIDPEHAQNLRAEARSKAVCGECKSSTFLLWRLQNLSHMMEKDEVIRGEERRGITSFGSTWVSDDEEPDARAGVIVRCAFFRMNVPDPFRIVDCEGFKQRKDNA